MSMNLSIIREEVRVLNNNIASGGIDSLSKPWLVSRVTDDFRCYGGALQIWDAVIAGEPQAVIHGPAETGKSMACLHLVNHLCWTYPHIQAAFVRKTYADMPGTIIQTFEQKCILMRKGENKSPDGITKYGGEKVQFYDYPNGSRIWVGGMDHPGKILSGERDIVLVNQAEELDENDWSTISTRTTGRAGALKPGRLIGDCNPGPSTHWIISHAEAGTLKMFASHHEDNPTLFDPVTHEITPQGILSLEQLDKLPGVLYKRLRKGLWVAAEGVVYDDYDPAIHIVDKPVSEIQYYIAGIDWGFTNPGVMQVWGVDSDERMYRTEEIYQTGKFVAASKPEDAWWIIQGKRIAEKYPKFKYFVADPSEPQYIEALETAGLEVHPAFNSVELGIQNVQSRMKKQADGYPRIMIIRGSRQSPADPVRKSIHRPTCLEEELEVYAWPKEATNKNIKEEPVAKDNHACDAMRYAAAEVDGLGENDFWFA
jgi:PBSX family phage terminase large subunit